MKNYYFGGLVLVVTIVAIFIIRNEKKKIDTLLNLPQSYVIGIVIEKRFPTYGDPVIVYTYAYQGETYKKEATIPSYKVKEGDRYFVSIPVGHEGEGIFLFDKPVSKSLELTPPNGWEEIP